MELAAYRTRSLPSWGKGNKQRPVSTADDLEELYAKVSIVFRREIVIYIWPLFNIAGEL